MQDRFRDDPNVAMLRQVAAALGELCDELVFVGGCAAGLLVTRVRAEAVRVTRDVDAVAEVFSAQEYHALEARLPGFIGFARNWQFCSRPRFARLGPL